MKAEIVINIDDKSLVESGLSSAVILDITLDRLVDLYNQYNLDFDCGYNPQLVTNGKTN